MFVKFHHFLSYLLAKPDSRWLKSNWLLHYCHFCKEVSLSTFKVTFWQQNQNCNIADIIFNFILGADIFHSTLFSDVYCTFSVTSKCFKSTAFGSCFCFPYQAEV